MMPEKEAVSSAGKSKQSKGGTAVHKKYGSDYMRKLGKKGRKKQLLATKQD